MKKISSILLLILISAAVFAAKPKYVFYMIGDGMGLNHVQATVVYNQATGGPEVNFNNFPIRTYVTTRSANSGVTDSAAAGTALATGTKTNNGNLGTDPDAKPLVSLAEMAKAKGYAAGVATSVGVNHATPGAFYGKVKNRGEYNTIAEQLIAHNLDFAAGECFLVENGKGMTSADFARKARENGINVFVGKDEVKDVKGRVIMLANGDFCPPSIDRKEGDTRLEDFTAAAINHLYKTSPKGFFLMVEGGKIDYAAHGQDAGWVVNEVNDFCRSIDLALAFMKKHPSETLIIVTSDHETSALSLGAGKYALLPELLAYQKCSINTLSEGITKLSKKGEEVSWAEFRDFLKDNTGLFGPVEVSDKEKAVLAEMYKETFICNTDKEEKNLYATNKAVALEALRYLYKKAGLTLPIRSHSGANVGLFVKGAGAEKFLECRDNTDIPKTIAKLAGY